MDNSNDPVVFTVDIEQKLLSAHQEYLDQRQAYMLQWMQALDVQVNIANTSVLVISIGMIYLAYRLWRLEDRVASPYRKNPTGYLGTHEVFVGVPTPYRTGDATARDREGTP